MVGVKATPRQPFLGPRENTRHGDYKVGVSPGEVQAMEALRAGAGSGERGSQLGRVSRAHLGPTGRGPHRCSRVSACGALSAALSEKWRLTILPVRGR